MKQACKDGLCSHIQYVKSFEVNGIPMIRARCPDCLDEVDFTEFIRDEPRYIAQRDSE